MCLCVWLVVVCVSPHIVGLINVVCCSQPVLSEETLLGSARALGLSLVLVFVLLASVGRQGVLVAAHGQASLLAVGVAGQSAAGSVSLWWMGLSAAQLTFLVVLLALELPL